MKVQANNYLNRKVNQYRQLSGNRIVEMGIGLRELFKKIKDKEIIAFLIDQAPSPEVAVYVDFFGVKTASYSGPAKLALKYRPELYMSYTLRNKNYKYKSTYFKIGYDDLLNEDENNILILTERIQKAAEKIIRSNPGQWFWLHKRFKRIIKND